MFKWLSLKKNNLADNSWVQDESLLLDQIVKYFKFYLENTAKIVGAKFHKNFSYEIQIKIKFIDVLNSVDNIGTAT